MNIDNPTLNTPASGTLTNCTGLPAAGISDATTIGKAHLTLTNPSAISWNRNNADNTVTALSASLTRTAMDVNIGISQTNALVEVSSAEVLALFTTTKTLVAAGGANTVNNFVMIQIAYDYGGTPYTLGAAVTMIVRYTNAAGTAVSAPIALAGFIDQATDQVRTVFALSATSLTPVVNATLELLIQGADVTLGNGTLHCRVMSIQNPTGL